MTKHRNQWSKKEKLTALALAKKEGFLQASKQLGISQTSLYKWRDKLETLGDEGLSQVRLLPAANGNKHFASREQTA